MSGYRRYGRQGPRPARWMALKYAGKCSVCVSSAAVVDRPRDEYEQARWEEAGRPGNAFGGHCD